MSRLSVVCWLWGTKYTPEHVNRLRAMVRRNLRLPHDFYCITDNAAGLDEFVKVVPIWNDFASWNKHRRRLKIFSSEMKAVLGERILQIDLDMVLTGDITPLVNIAEDFCIWRCPSVGVTKYAYNPSFLLMNSGARSWVWDTFVAQPKHTAEQAKKAGWTGTDQAVIGHLLAPKELTWDDRDGLWSFRDHILGRNYRELPARVKVVGFYGPYDQADETLYQRYPWIRAHWRSLRMDILDVLIERHSWTKGAELGVLRGDTYFHLLDCHPLLSLIGVDAWTPIPGPDRGPDGFRSFANYPLEEYAASVQKRAQQYHQRARVIRKQTAEAARDVADGSLDFVFIDADHTENAVREDIRLWAPKLKPTGWLLGHDTHFPGVQRAIDAMLPGWRQWPDYTWSIERSAISC